MVPPRSLLQNWTEDTANLMSHQSACKGAAGIERAIAQRTRKRCGDVRQRNFKVLHRVSQSQSPTKLLQKEPAQTRKHCRQGFKKLQSTDRALLHALHKSWIMCKQLLS